MICRVTTLALAFAALASAQITSVAVVSAGSLATLTSSISLPSGVQPSDVITNTASVPSPSATSYPLDIPSIPFTMRTGWCQSQRDTCRALCSNNYKTDGNRCDPDTLDYACQCNAFATPDIAQFNGSIPFSECQYYQGICVLATDNAETQRACRSTQCGGPVAAADYAPVSSSATSTMMSTTSSGGSDSSSPTMTPATADNGNAAPTQMAQGLGLGFIVAGAALAGLAL